jgi:DNA ligase-1
VLFAEIVATSEEVAATAARTAKVAALADLLTRLEPAETEAAVGFLTARPRQGRFGVGWATLGAVVATPAADPQLTIADLDAAIESLCGVSGPGSAAARSDALSSLLARATAAEGSFIRRLLMGELRQGAVEGVMADAVAKASGVSLAAVRRAVMLAGDLGPVATIALREGADGIEHVGLEVLRPIKPMLASTSAGGAPAVADSGVWSGEW